MIEYSSRRTLPAVLLALALIPIFVMESGRALAQGSVVTAPAPTAASDVPTIPRGLSPAEIDARLARVTDADARRILLERLHGEARARAATTSAGQGGGLGVALVRLRHGLEGFTETLVERMSVLGTGAAMAPGELSKALRAVTGGPNGPGLAVLLASLAILYGVGMFAHWLVRRLTAENRRRIETTPPIGLWSRILHALLRALFDLLALAAFAVVTFGLSAMIFEGGGAGRTFVVTYLTGALAVYATAMVSRLALAADVPALRLVPLGDGLAIFLHRWLVRLAAVGCVVWLTAGLLILTGMAIETHLLIVMVTGAIVFGAVMAMIVSSRKAVAQAIRGDALPPGATGDTVHRMRHQFAGLWHYLAIAYMIVVWSLWSMSMLARGPSTIWPAIASIAVVVALPLVDRALGRGLAKSFAGAAKSDGLPRYVNVVRRGVRVILVAVAAVLVLQLWGVNVLAGAGPGAADAFWDAVFDISVTLLLASVIWQLVKTATDRHLTTKETEDGTEAPNARALTLLPLLRKCVFSVLAVLATLIVLSSIGVDIGPLLAGAGVIGLAVGFGAQTLVRDIVSGVFFLIDDAFRIGEYIEMGEIRGEVEAISLRSLRLRHHRGAIHTIPFGELRSITNYNRDWVIYKMEFRVPYDTDIEKVRKIIKQIGLDMLEDPEIGPNFLEPLKSQGVSRMEESAFILRAKFMCKPREQFVIRRVAYQRIQEAFEANGIEFAHRNVTVHVPPKGEGDRKSEQGAAAALATSGENP